MSSLKEAIKLSAEFYKCNDTLRQLFKDTYKEKSEVYRKLILKTMEKEKNAISAVTKILSNKKLKNQFSTGHESGVFAMWLLAACVDVIEDNTNSEKEVGSHE